MSQQAAQISEQADKDFKKDEYLLDKTNATKVKVAELTAIGRTNANDDNENNLKRVKHGCKRGSMIEDNLNQRRTINLNTQS